MSVNPADSQIFGSLFGTDEMRDLISDRAQLAAMLEVEAALARAEASLGIIPREAAATIPAAARVELLSLDKIAASTRTVGYPVVALVAELGRAAGADAARYIHLGATTQDIVDTALVLQMRRAVAVLRRDLIVTARALADHALRYRDTPIAGRTHLQHAVPTTFGLKCATWAAPLAAHVARLDQAAARIFVVQFGGAAGTLAALGANGPAVAAALGRELDLGTPDLPWHVTRDGLAEAAAICALICGSLSKFAFDIILLTQTEVAEVFEPHSASAGSSSTMPQKRNPILSEYILAATRAVHAMVPIVFSAMTQDHERATGPWQSESLAIPQIFTLTAGALARARDLAAGMIADPARMRRNLDATRGLIMAEALAAFLTPSMGRAAAHHAVARACDRARAEDRALADVVADDAELGRRLSREDIQRAMNPASYLGSAGVFVDRVAARVAALK
ncbi:MAG TPA: 3-carboxy-cis,cis-muconate cycloisomerase [Candidatus Binataceae bacterium]|nr:3-carboxy-cis,cis-muconate cycloisomerase [Candidatus Binataceae bacterium]